jgi:type IV pilus assembly protein PilF
MSNSVSASLGERARPWRGVGFALLLGAALLAGCVNTTAPVSGAERRQNNVDAAAINVQLGLDYLQKNELSIAQGKLERALGEDPDSPDVHDALAQLDERLGDSKGADREYRRALALSHRSPQMVNNYAVYMCSHGRAPEAVRLFDEAAANPIYPTPWAAYTNAGICLHSVHHDDEAMLRFARALQANPAFADAVFQAASLEYAQQHLVAARLRLDVFLMSNPPTPSLLLLGWQIARAQSDLVGEHRFEQVLSNDFPASTQARALQLAGRSGAD